MSKQKAATQQYWDAIARIQASHGCTSAKARKIYRHYRQGKPVPEDGGPVEAAPLELAPGMKPSEVVAFATEQSTRLNKRIFELESNLSALRAEQEQWASIRRALDLGGEGEDNDEDSELET